MEGMDIWRLLEAFDFLIRNFFFILGFEFVGCKISFLEVVRGRVGVFGGSGFEILVYFVFFIGCLGF